MDLGKIQKMTIARIEPTGAYLEDGSGEPAVLLPRREVPEGVVPGDELDVYLYRDSEDRLITTLNPPPLEVGGGLALLEVAQINQVGAFLDWGLMKDLFLPYQEQRGSVREGQKVLVALYVDESDRLCATMRVYDFLRPDSPYRKDDVVRGTVYQVSDELGVLIAVDNRYYGLIPKHEVFRAFTEGEEVEARVVRVCDDGKLDLAVRKKAHEAIGGDAQRVLEELDMRGGSLPFTDKASPGLIREELAMSKSEFKRAVGHLLKEGRIRIEEDSIALCSDASEAGKVSREAAERRNRNDEPAGKAAELGREEPAVKATWRGNEGAAAKDSEKRGANAARTGKLSEGSSANSYKTDANAPKNRISGENPFRREGQFAQDGRNPSKQGGKPGPSAKKIAREARREKYRLQAKAAKQAAENAGAKSADAGAKPADTSAKAKNAGAKPADTSAKAKHAGAKSGTDKTQDIINKKGSADSKKRIRKEEK